MKKPWTSARCVDDIYAVLTLKSLQNQSEPCPEITGLIMIDCWPSSAFNTHLGEFCEGMLPRLDRHTFKIAVNACYAHDTYTVGKLNPVLRDYLFQKCDLIDITRDQEFFQGNQIWKITNWLVVGLTWNICFHTRPMGINQLLRQSQQEQFFIDPNCVLTEDLDTLTEAEVRSDQLLWQKVNDLGYRLVK